MSALAASDPLAAKAAEIEARLRRPMTFLQLWREVREWVPKTQQILDTARKLRNVTADRRRALEQLAARLQAVRGPVKVGYSSTPNAPVPAPLQTEAREAIVGVVRWVSAAAARELKASAARAAIVKAATDAPGKGLKWALDQLRTALGLPTWAIPVVGAGLGLIALAYVANTARAFVPRGRAS